MALSGRVKLRRRIGSRGSYGSPPHPTRVRIGQLFWSRGPPAASSWCSVERGGRVVGEFDDRSRTQFALARLLELRADGQGAHYQFVGFRWRPRDYDTEATVHALHGGEAELRFPELHTDRPILVAASLLPATMRDVGAPLLCRADLGFVHGGPLAYLNPSDFRAAPRAPPS